MTALLTLVVWGLAAYGCYTLFHQVTRPSEDSVRECCELLDRLRRAGRIDEIEYLKMRSALAATGRPLTIAVSGPEVTDQGQKARGPWSSSSSTPLINEPIIQAVPVLDETTLTGLEETGTPPVPTAPHSPAARPSQPGPFQPPPWRPAAAVIGRPPSPAAVHPLDVEDEPVVPPKKKPPLSDVLMAFMVKRNIRWGELASGILIVGSALGLVVSLREQLRDAIPYFPALLFLLITAAIHAAGTYTLRRWRLRNTSRGVLVIGLLLVPLNFLAACILTSTGPDRRPITDPVYWIAVLTGTIAFSLMTWISGKSLLRRRQWPLFVGVMGCSLSLLVINRVATHAPNDSWKTLLLSAVPTLALAVAVMTIRPGQWQRTHWSSRDTARLWLNLAIVVFAFAAALALMIVRAMDRLPTLVALTPALVIALSLVGGAGLLVQQGTHGPGATSQRLAGTAIAVLAGALTGVAVVLGAINPTVMVGTSSLAASATYMMARNRRLPWLSLATWICVAAAVWCAMHVALGNFRFDHLTTWGELQRAVFSGASGWCLMTVGGGVAAIHGLLPQIMTVQGTALAQRRRLGVAAGAIIACTGLGLALLASLFDRQNAFDQHTASLLLSIGAAIAVVRGRSLGINSQAGATGASAMVAITLMHGLIWNRFLGTRINEWTHGIDIRWELVTVTSSVVLAVAAWVVRKRDDKKTLRWRQTLSVWGTAVAWVTLVAAAAHLQIHAGIATALATTAALALGLFAAARVGVSAAPSFCLATAIVVGFATTEFAFSSVQDDLPLPQGTLALMVCSGLAIWCVVWSALFAYGSRRWLDWMLADDFRVHEWVLVGLVTTVLYLLVRHLLPMVADELFADHRFDVAFSLGEAMPWVRIAMGLVALSVMVGLATRPQPSQAVALIMLWTAGWCLAGQIFQDVNAVGTAIRWLVPIGGAAGAVALGSRRLWLPAWQELRAALRLTEPGGWSTEFTQTLLNLWLIMIGTTVLAITTVAVSQVMLHGAQSLGGPIGPSFFADLRKDISYGGPIAVMVTILLWFAITERRSELAMAGSGVFQYFVALAVVLLFLSPHPQLASAWFLNIVQTVSLGMSAYGLVWYFFRSRIGGRPLPILSGMTALDSHVALNAILVASLVVLILVRFFTYPTATAGWINEAGGWLGFAALLVVTGLTYRVWTERVRAGFVMFASAVSLALVTFFASLIDRSWQPCPWYAFRAITGGMTLLSALSLAGTIGLQWHRGVARCRRPEWFLPVLVPGAIAVLFAARGAPVDARAFWFYSTCLGTILAACVVYGCQMRSVWASALAVGLVSIQVFLQVASNRWPWLAREEQAFAHLLFVGWLLLAIVWLGYYLLVRGHEERAIRRAFLRMPNIVVLLAVCWIGWCGFTELFDFGSTRILGTPLGTTLMCLTILHLTLDLWNDRARLRVANRHLGAVGLASHGVSLVAVGFDRVPTLAFALAVTVAGWGYMYSRRREFRYLGRRWGVPRLAARADRLARSLPWTNLITSVWALLLVVVTISFSRERGWRYLAAFTPAVLAGGFLPLSDKHHSRGMQALSIFLLTLAGMILALADVGPQTMWSDPLVVPTRLFVAFAVAVFVHGWIIPRRLGPNSHWMQTVREATVVTSFLAITSFLGLLAAEWSAM